MSATTNSTPTVWSIHAGQNGQAQRLFLEHNYIALGWPATGHLGVLPNDQDAFKAKVLQTHPGDTSGVAQFAGQLRHFVYDVRIGDLVVYRPEPLKNVEPLIFLGRIAGPYLYNPYIHDHYPNLRRVEWLRSVPVSHFSKEALAEQSAAMTLSQIDTHAQEYLAALDGVF